MVSRSEHIIRRQIADIEMPSSINRLAVTQRLEFLLEEELPRRLEPIFDRLVGPDIWIDIDLLEIDLGDLSLWASDEDWLAQAIVSYTKALEHYLESEQLTNITLSTTTQHKNSDSRNTQVSNSNQQKKLQTPHLSPAEQDFELVIYYLEHGYLPWWANARQFELALDRLIEQQAKSLIEKFFNSRILKRWTWQIPEAKQLLLLEALEQQLPESFISWPEKLEEGIKVLARMKLWESIWNRLLYTSNLNSEAVDKSIGDEIEELKNQFSINKSSQVLRQKEPLITSTNRQRIASYLSSDEQEPKFDTYSPIHTEGIYVSLAGIVLIHPFLDAFFRQVNLLDQEQFRDLQALHRAIHLLHYIASGEAETDESQSPLLKILCGFAPENVLGPLWQAIRDEEKTEIENMIQAVSGHWPALEGSSLEGLRETFFQREGRLSHNEMGWQLLVEQYSVDIIFQSLPWGLSPIQFPWMPELLWVEWA